VLMWPQNRKFRFLPKYVLINYLDQNKNSK